MDKLHEFLGKVLVDFGATFHAALVRIGDKLGLYKGLAAGGPQTPTELAERTGTVEGYVCGPYNSSSSSSIFFKMVILCVMRRP